MYHILGVFVILALTFGTRGEPEETVVLLGWDQEGYALE
jgi:hypothetical protein